MKIMTLSRDESISIFSSFQNNNAIPAKYFDDLSNEYKKIREDLISIEQQTNGLESYKADLQFGLKIYKYFNSQDWFNETIAGNYGFWWYISLKVVPDLIARRCGFVSSYFYEKTTRMYVPKLWWYVHMSYQGTLEKTEEILKRLNTDYIMQLVERTGRGGFYLEVTREIMRCLSVLPASEINKKVNGSNLFRRVLIQNTAKIENYNLVAEDKIKKYVYDLFKSCKVEVSQYE